MNEKIRSGVTIKSRFIFAIQGMALGSMLVRIIADELNRFLAITGIFQLEIFQLEDDVHWISVGQASKHYLFSARRPSRGRIRVEAGGEPTVLRRVSRRDAGVGYGDVY